MAKATKGAAPRAKTPRKAAAAPKSTKTSARSGGDVFAAAEAKPAAGKKKAAGPKAKTLLRIPDMAGDAVHNAVPGFRKAKLQVKSGEAQVEANRNELAPIATRLFAEAWVAQGGPPEKPVALVNRDGEHLTHVLQDKTALAVLSDDVRDELVALIPGAAKLLVEETQYAIDPAVLAEEGVREAIAAAIAAADITDEQRAGLLVAKKVHRTRESLVPHLLTLCGSDADCLADALNILRGPLTRYLNA